MSQKNLSVHYVDIGTLIPYINNARIHSDGQVAQIAASIKEFGFNNPILTDGDNGIIAGHGRLLAAQKLGLDKVPTIELSHLTPAQKRAFILADNRIAENAEWDMELVRQELESLEVEGFDLSLTGFNLDDLLEEDGTSESEKDDVPEPPAKPVTRKYDVWHLSVHTLMCDDATSSESINQLVDAGGGKPLPDRPTLQRKV